jgi:outer membrane lipoprotein LolB
MTFGKKILLIIIKQRHSRESGNPRKPFKYWIPAFVGMTDKVIKQIFTIITILLLSACATVPQPGTHYLTWQQRQQQLQATNSWDMYAVLGVRFAGKNTMVHFYWQQIANNFTINISTPINIGGVIITGSTKQVTLWRSATDKIVAKTPEQLMYQELGWSLPLFDLKYWVLGLPAPHIPYNAKFDMYNHLSYLKQQGWEIEYADFRSIGNIDLPQKIWLENPKLRAKLVIKKWRILK